MNIEEIIKETVREVLQESKSNIHHYHKDYRLFEADKHIVAIFEDNSKLFFEVHFRNNHGEDRGKHRHKAFTKWKSLANEIHSDIQLTEAGNRIEKSWKQSFQEALKHPELQEYIRHSPHHKVFSNMDPVNFTPRV